MTYSRSRRKKGKLAETLNDRGNRRVLELATFHGCPNRGLVHNSGVHESRQLSDFELRTVMECLSKRKVFELANFHVCPT